MTVSYECVRKKKLVSGLQSAVEEGFTENDAEQTNRMT